MLKTETRPSVRFEVSNIYIYFAVASEKLRLDRLSKGANSFIRVRETGELEKWVSSESLASDCLCKLELSYIQLAQFPMRKYCIHAFASIIYASLLKHFHSERAGVDEFRFVIKSSVIMLLVPHQE